MSWWRERWAILVGGNPVARILVSFVTAATLGVSFVYFGQSLSRLDKGASENGSLSFADREIAGGNSVIADQQAAYEARALIPPQATYRVVTGDALRNATPLTAAFVEIWFRGFLMPRRPSPDARWVVCYGCDVTRLGGSYRAEWHDANNISIGRLL